MKRLILALVMPVLASGCATSRATREAPPPAPTEVTGAADLLYFIDGRSANRADVEGLPPSTIERIEILKGTAAAALYGTAARRGVVLVSTKGTGR